MDTTDSGGVAAKHGFLYQDCAAAWLASEMLMDKRIKAIRCEVVDDIDVVWENYTEFIQVKAAEDKSWTPVTITKNTKGADNKTIKNTSIVHKSMTQATKPISACKFRIISSEKPKGLLSYLRGDRSTRLASPERESLFLDLDTRLHSFVALNGNNVEHWINSTWWQVLCSIREIELLAIKNIRNAAVELVGVTLNSEQAAESIWRDILYTVTKKSALSRKIYCEDDKTYFREHLVDWFKSEILYHERSSFTRHKIYANKSLPKILNPLWSLGLPTAQATRRGKVMHQAYNLRTYRYTYIAQSVTQWIDEVLLLPEEIADTSGITTAQRYQKLSERLNESITELEAFLGKVLLHATIRHSHQSQPIPASLYVDHPLEMRILENVHIVPSASRGDELWVGFSHIFQGTTLPDCLLGLRTALYQDIMDNIDPARAKILDVKQDSYLLTHDINELLDTSQPLDSYLKRYRFILFFGYNSSCMTEPETQGYESSLKAETERLFLEFTGDLASSGFDAVNIDVYFYPVPNMTTLLNSVRVELEKICA